MKLFIERIPHTHSQIVGVDLGEAAYGGRFRIYFGEVRRNFFRTYGGVNDELEWAKHEHNMNIDDIPIILNERTGAVQWREDN